MESLGKSQDESWEKEEKVHYFVDYCYEHRYEEVELLEYSD